MMNKKILSLCIILIVLIICTTVNATEDVTANDTTVISAANIEEANLDTSTITAKTKEVSKKKMTTKTKKESSQTTETNKEDTITKKNVQKNSNSTDNSTIEVNALTVRKNDAVNADPLNISGKITKVYDKENNKYAGGEEDGIAAEGAKISLYNENTGKLIGQTTSNKDGDYVFKNLNKGNYSLEFSYGTYAIGEESITLINNSRQVDYVFIPDIAIIAFSADSAGNGQQAKADELKKISDRVYFLESYNLNSSYDTGDHWMLDFAEFILVDMYSMGNGFGVDIDLIAKSPASKNQKIAYTFGVYDDATLRVTLGNWGFLGGNPHSVENTYIGSYWQAIPERNQTVIKTNMRNMFDYIRYLLKETDVNPTTTGRSPIYVSSSWGIYYPGFKGNVKTPDPSLINQWILENPGYNHDNSGSLNWMTDEYSAWNLKTNAPAKIFQTFEKWYDSNKKLKTPFIIIANYYEGGEVVDALIKEYEKQGRAVFSVYKITAEDPDMTSLLEMATTNKSIIRRGVSAVSYMYWWTTGYAQRGTNYTINAYKNMDIALINALKDISQYSYNSEYGPQNEWTAAVTMPEFEGVFGAIPVSYIDENQTTVIIKEGLEKHVQLTNGWARLKELNNKDKKVSIILYGYPPGKANIGASYLDVFQSLHDLLEKLYDEGYDLGLKEKSEIPNTEEINNIVTDFANKGQWAEGLLDLYVVGNYENLTKHGQLVSKSQYMKWYNDLPKNLKDDIDEDWGTGLGNGSMIYREKVEVNKIALQKWLDTVPENLSSILRFNWNKNIIISENSTSYVMNKTRFYQWYGTLPYDVQKSFNKSRGFGLANETPFKNEGYFLVPGMFFKNIFISVQPVRGWESQIDFHNSYLAPPQQYVAYYKYLNTVFKNDAIVHMGTHGTLEWLPGRTLGLQSTDWPFQLIDTPIIYPYIVSNPGEGMTAKERSFSQVITHMTPVTSSTSLYGEYVELNDAIARYDSSKTSGVEDNMVYYKDLILNLTESLGYAQPDYMKVAQLIEDYKLVSSGSDPIATQQAKDALVDQAKVLGFDSPRVDEPFNDWLAKVEKYVNSNDAFEEWLAIIHSDIEAMSADKINYGMHTLGKVWNDTDMITGVTTIASSRTNVLEDIMNIYYPDIKESYYDKSKERDFDPIKQEINKILVSIVTNLVEGVSIDEIANSHGVFNTSSNFYNDIVEINSFIVNIRNNLEWESIMGALSGGYVEPGLAADPSYSDVLPTGRSMYTSDTTKMPSKSAWSSAVNSVNQMLIKYMLNMGEETFPELVGEVIWGTEVLRTEGISLSQFLYLLGVKPTWDNTGTVNGTEIIPLEELTLNLNGTIYNRPRIDVFATIVSNNPNWIGLLTEAVEKVSRLNESENDNYVIKHLKENPSTERLFGLPGAVLEGTGVSDMLNNAISELGNDTDLSYKIASVYESRISHSWNVDQDGNIVVKDNSEIFSYLLEHVSLVIQNLDSTWRYLDSDDYLDWFGGLLNAANVHGATPNTILLDIRDKNNIVTNTLGEEVKRETRTTILNPQWLEGMTSIVGGWNQMASNFENLMKTIFTTQKYQENQRGKAVAVTSQGNNAGVVGDGLLREVAELITESDYFKIDAQYKSYAFQSMAGWLLTSEMSGFWKNGNSQLTKNLLQKYVDNANKYGVACCHHTCNNINLHSWIIKRGTELGVSGLEDYSEIYASATNNPNAQYSTEPTSSPTPSSEGSSDVDASEGVNEYLNRGGTGESHADAMAMTGASALSDAGNSNSNSSVMTSQDNGGSGAGDSGSGSGSGDTGTGSGSGSSSGSGTGTANTNGMSGTNGTSTSDGTTDAGESPSSGSSSAGGESGSSSSATAVYELAQKNIGTPPSPKSEISLGYIVSIILVALLFFLGFTKRDNRFD